jgi:transcriptional regulatory protein LevR
MVKEKSLAMTVRYHLNMTISLGAIGERMVKEKSLAMTVRYHLNDTKNDVIMVLRHQISATTDRYGIWVVRKSSY